MFFVLLITAVVLLVVYIKIRHFTLHGPIPGKQPYFFFGNLIDTGILLRGVSLPQALAEYKTRFGDIFQFWLGSSRLVVVGNVNDVQHIFNNRNIYDQGKVFIEKASVLLSNGLLCVRGATFKRHAAATIPLFRRAKIMTNLDLIIDYTDKLMNNYRREPLHKVHTDILDQSRNLLLALFGYIGFDYDLETLNGDGRQSENELTQALQYMVNTFEMVFYFPGFMSTVILNLSPKYRQARRTIEKYLKQMIDKEISESAESRAERKRTCLIASLVASRQLNEQEEANKAEDEKKGLSLSEIIDETLLFLVAGYDTTSTALAWFIHLMSKHPDVQQKIKAELTNDGHSQTLTADRLDSLIYLDCVVKEVLRFCPPISGTQRTLTMDDRLPESGCQLRKGDSVLIPFCTLAYDSRYWSVDPERFYPERFLNEDKNHHPYAYVPFGNGHRQCIGQDLARFELKVIAARLMQCVTFGDGGPDVNAGGHRTALTIMPKRIGVTIQFDS